MKRLFLLTVIVLSPLLAMGLVSPEPVAAQTELLQNGAFESFDGSGLATSWNRWWEEVPNPNTGSLDYAGKPDWAPELNTALTLGGKSQHIGTTWNPWHAGVYQVVSAAPGTQIHITAAGRVFTSNNNFPNPSDSSDNAHMQIGADPTGGTNWWAGTVQWSAQGNPHDTWQSFSLDVTAGASGQVTIFLGSNFRGESRFHQDTWWENASATTGGSAPAPTVTPLPEATNIPSAPQATAVPTTVPSVPSGGTGTTIYTIRAGDTLFGISIKFGVSISAIMQANGMTSTLIFAGQTLKIPGTSGGSSSGGSTSGGSTSGGSTSGGTTTTTTTGKCGATYAVRAGDTLRTIATSCGSTITAIAALNGIVNIDLIFVGQVLKMPGVVVVVNNGGSSGGNNNPPPASTPVPTNNTGNGKCPAIYTIQRGDTLGIIANKCGVTASAILASNTLPNPSLIYPGQKLSIPGGQGSGSTTPPVTSTPVPTTPQNPAPTPTPAPVNASHGITGQLTLCNPEKPSFAATIERICFHETLFNTTAAGVKYGILGVQATNLSGGPNQFQTSWRGDDLTVPPGGQGPAGGNWEDGIYITQPGTYRLQLAVCFSSVDGCLAGVGWETITSGVNVKVVFWQP